MVDVFITVDTELWPLNYAGWPNRRLPAEKTDFSAEFSVYFDGKTRSGDYGVPYQISRLNHYGLKATYFVEPLFSLRAGSDYLKHMVTAIEGQRQEAQLHLHTEWLSEIQHPKLPSQFRQHLRQFDQAEQTTLLRVGADLLRGAGAGEICAFRAGNYGANLTTLSALASNGIRFDTSYNACYQGGACDMPGIGSGLSPREVEGVVEYPVSHFADFRHHRRHVQFCACSFSELRHLLLQAWQRQLPALVIVMHPFELIRKDPHLSTQGLALPVHSYIRRFEKLCQFLGENRDRFHTRHFRDLTVDRALAPASDSQLESNGLRTVGRMAEQAVARFW